MVYIPLKAMYLFRELFEKKLEGYSVRIVHYTDFERIYILEDSLVLLVSFKEDTFPVCCNAKDFYGAYIDKPFLGLPTEDETYYDFVIEELTPNEISFKFNTKAFIAEAEALIGVTDLGFDIRYTKFQGYHRLYWCLDTETTAERINRVLPELQLRDRYDAWVGIPYNFIIYEFEDINGNLHYASSYTKISPLTYVNKMGKQFIRTGSFTNGNTRVEQSGGGFSSAIGSWKGTPRQKRIEEHLKYFVVEKSMKEADDVWRYADKLIVMAQNGELSNYERFSYVRPTNKWVTEELVYKLAKKIYKQYKVIYQHRPFYLKSSIGGQMSYDIFISGLNVAIEYQGKQHFEPVDFFGGEDSFLQLQRRDKEKMELSKKHDVTLVYINYWEEVNEKLIRMRVEEALQSNHR